MKVLCAVAIPRIINIVIETVCLTSRESTLHPHLLFHKLKANMGETVSDEGEELVRVQQTPITMSLLCGKVCSCGSDVQQTVLGGQVFVSSL